MAPLQNNTGSTECSSITECSDHIHKKSNIIFSFFFFKLMPFFVHGMMTELYERVEI